MLQQVIISPTPIPPLNYTTKLLTLLAKGAFLGGVTAFFIATKKYHITRILDLRKHLANRQFFTHTQSVGALGAVKGAGLGLIWYTLYYQLFDVPNYPRDYARTITAYTIMGTLTTSLLLNSALAGVGFFSGMFLGRYQVYIGGASLLKSKGSSWKPEGSQVYYVNVGQKQRNKVLADYNLRLLGEEYALLNENNQYVLPSRP